MIVPETPVAESNEEKPAIILDYGARDNLAALTNLDVSRYVAYQPVSNIKWAHHLHELLYVQQSVRL